VVETFGRWWSFSWRSRKRANAPAERSSAGAAFSGGSEARSRAWLIASTMRSEGVAPDAAGAPQSASSATTNTAPVACLKPVSL
jgi:hypothetical protein